MSTFVKPEPNLVGGFPQPLDRSLRSLGLARLTYTQPSAFRGCVALFLLAQAPVTLPSLGSSFYPAPGGNSLAATRIAWPGAEATPTATKPRRERELRWLRTHRPELQALAGQWIALDGDVLLASGPDPVEVIREARRKGIRAPFLHRVEFDREAGSVRMGL